MDVLKFINKLRNKKNVPHKEILEVLDKEGFKKYIAVDMEVVQENTSKQTFEQTMFTLDEVRKIVAEELEKAMEDQANKKDEQIMYLMREIQDLKRIMIEEKQAVLEIDSSKQQLNNEEVQEIKRNRGGDACGIAESWRLCRESSLTMRGTLMQTRQGWPQKGGFCPLGLALGV
ncbi:hypothetical protein AAHB64_30365 [Bacillus toyonensis]